MSLLAPEPVETAELPLAAELAVPALPRVDLLPPEIGERRRLRRVQTGLGGALLGSACIVGLLWAGASGSVADEQARLDAATAVAADLRAQQGEFAGVLDTRRRAQRAEEVLTAAMGQEVRFSRLLDTLGRSTPSGVWLTDVTISQTAPAAGQPGTSAAADAAAAGAPPATGRPAIGTVTITATGFDHENVAAWLESLATAPGFAHVGFTTADESLLGGRKVVTFSSTATLTDEALSGRYARKGQ